jgi:hypothetical protein
LEVSSILCGSMSNCLLIGCPYRFYEASFVILQLIKSTKLLKKEATKPTIMLEVLEVVDEETGAHALRASTMLQGKSLKIILLSMWNKK